MTLYVAPVRVPPDTTDNTEIYFECERRRPQKAIVPWWSDPYKGGLLLLCDVARTTAHRLAICDTNGPYYNYSRSILAIEQRVRGIRISK